MEPPPGQEIEEPMPESLDNDAQAILGFNATDNDQSQVSDRLRFYQTQLDGDSSDDEADEQRLRSSNEEKVPYTSFVDENNYMLDQDNQNDDFIESEEIPNDYVQLNDAVDDDFGEFQGFISDSLERNVDDIIRIHLNTIDDAGRGGPSIFGSMTAEAKNEDEPASAVTNNNSWAAFDAPAIAPLSAGRH